MPTKPIYLDYMATTPVDPRVVQVMNQYLGPDGQYGNPSSTTHYYGKMAAQAIEKARLQVAESIGAKEEEIVFTSGATEADNLAIIGAARFYQAKGRHLITMMTEHKAVLESFEYLESQGFEVTYLKPQPDGLLDLDDLKNALRKETILVSIMHVNNEIGVIQPIASIAQLLKNKGIIFHVDAAQSAGKLALDVNTLGVELMSLSAHKNYGPKGVGALYVRHKPRIRIEPLSFGGGHQGGMRSGTLATHQIAGMGEAFYLSNRDRENEQASILNYRNQLWAALSKFSGVHLNGHLTERVAGNLNVSFSGLDETMLLTALSDLAVSTTSACASASSLPSHVLKAIGVPEDLALSSIRLSMGRFTTADDVKKVIQIFEEKIPVLRQLLP